MKTITRSNIYLPMAAMILTAALAVPAAAQQQVPFKGTFQGNDTVTLPTITQSITGIGHACRSILISLRSLQSGRPVAKGRVSGSRPMETPSIQQWSAPASLRGIWYSPLPGCRVRSLENFR